VTLLFLADLVDLVLLAGDALPLLVAGVLVTGVSLTLDFFDTGVVVTGESLALAFFDGGVLTTGVSLALAFFDTGVLTTGVSLALAFFNTGVLTTGVSLALAFFDAGVLPDFPFLGPGVSARVYGVAGVGLRGDRDRDELRKLERGEETGLRRRESSNEDLLLLLESSSLESLRGLAERRPILESSRGLKERRAILESSRGLMLRLESMLEERLRLLRLTSAALIGLFFSVLSVLGLGLVSSSESESRDTFFPAFLVAFLACCFFFGSDLAVFSCFFLGALGFLTFSGLAAPGMASTTTLLEVLDWGLLLSSASSESVLPRSESSLSSLSSRALSIVDFLYTTLLGEGVFSFFGRRCFLL